MVLHVVLCGAVAREGHVEAGEGPVLGIRTELLLINVVLGALAAAKEQIGRPQLYPCAPRSMRISTLVASMCSGRMAIQTN
jgi:hypothetical protein